MIGMIASGRLPARRPMPPPGAPCRAMISVDGARSWARPGHRSESWQHCAVDGGHVRRMDAQPAHRSESWQHCAGVPKARAGDARPLRPAWRDHARRGAVRPELTTRVRSGGGGRCRRGRGRAKGGPGRRWAGAGWRLPWPRPLPRRRAAASGAGGRSGSGSSTRSAPLRICPRPGPASGRRGRPRRRPAP